MSEDYRSEIEEKIRIIKEKADIIASEYADTISEYLTEVSELDKRYLSDKIGIDAIPSLAEQWKNWFQGYSSRKGEEVEKVLTELSELVLTADTPEKKKILYEELEKTWKK